MMMNEEEEEEDQQQLIRNEEEEVKSPSNKNRVDEIYAMGVELHARRKEANGLPPEKLGCTFKPKINSRKEGKKEAIGMDRVNKLYNDAEIIRTKLETKKEKLLKSDTPSFKPEITAKASQKDTVTGIERANKLYENAEEIRKKKEMKKEKIMQEEGLTFSPTITSRAQRKVAHDRYESLYQRAMLQKKKEESIAKTYQPPECSFEPKVLQRRSSLPSNSDPTGMERLEKLFKDGQKNEMRREAKRAALKASAEQLHSPKINQNIKITKRASLYPSKVELENQERRREAMKAFHEMQGCTFLPGRAQDTEKSLPASSTKSCPDMSRKRTHRNKSANSGSTDSANKQDQGKASGSVISGSTQQSTDSVFDRLYSAGMERSERFTKLEQVAEVRRENEDWEKNAEFCTFEPEIQERSRRLSIDGDYFQYLHEDSVMRLNRRDTEVSSRSGLDLGCTFKPTICVNSTLIVNRLRSKYSNGETNKNATSASALDLVRKVRETNIPGSMTVHEKTSEVRKPKRISISDGDRVQRDRILRLMDSRALDHTVSRRDSWIRDSWIDGIVF